jgi:hypothetical protein
MMTLEDRARSAADAVHRSTSAYIPRAGVADLVRRRTARRAALVGAAGLAVFAALFVATWLAEPTIDEAAELPEPTVPTVDEPIVDEPSPAPVVEPPIDETLPVVVDPPQVEDGPAPAPEPDGGVLAAPDTTVPPSTTAVPEATTTAPPDTTPPVLIITAPEDGQVFDRTTIRFRGTTEPGAVVTAGKYVADVDDEGNWSIVLVLRDGGNRASFTATDAAGNESTASITVYYEEPKEEEPPPDVAFTAHSTYGSCELDPPYDVYYGTTEPGATVTITSEYGGGQVRADAEGHWELKVFFPEAPHEVVFPVKAKDEFGRSKTFEFVSLVPPAN